MSNYFQYDIFSMEHPDGRVFYFVWDLKNDVLECDGTDYSSMAYMLFFKIRDLGKNSEECARLLMTRRSHNEKNYLDSKFITFLKDQIEKDEKQLFRNWSVPLLPSNIHEGADEWELMEIIAAYNPKRSYVKNYKSESSWGIMFRDVILRDNHLQSMLQKATEKLKEANEAGTRNKIGLSDLFTVEDLRLMLEGPNGDLWINIFTLGKEPTKADLLHLYKAQGASIIENKNHLQDKELVLVAMNSTKNDLTNFQSVYNVLPKELKEDLQLSNLYHWQLEI